MRLDTFIAVGRSLRVYQLIERGQRRLLMPVAILLLSAATELHAQVIDVDMLPSVGDAPSVALPLATDISGKFDRKDIRRAMHKVADWQLAQSQQYFAAFDRSKQLDGTICRRFAGGFVEG